MIRALTLCFAALLPACTQFPVVDAAAPKVQDPRPPYLTRAELDAVNARTPVPQDDPAQQAGDDLRNSADDLRGR